MPKSAEFRTALNSEERVMPNGLGPNSGRANGVVVIPGSAGMTRALGLTAARGSEHQRAAVGPSQQLFAAGSWSSASDSVDEPFPTRMGFCRASSGGCSSTSERVIAARVLCPTRADECGATVTRCGFESRQSPVVLHDGPVPIDHVSWSEEGRSLTTLCPPNGPSAEGYLVLFRFES
jgi:hypothetical protein